jgi:hypothetical protein
MARPGDYTGRSKPESLAARNEGPRSSIIRARQGPSAFNLKRGMPLNERVVASSRMTDRGQSPEAGIGARAWSNLTRLER